MKINQYILVLLTLFSLSTLAGHVASEDDVAVTKLVRQTIMLDANLSTKAHNIDIIADGKVVTLRGPVDGKAEKLKVFNMAQRAAPGKIVHDELRVE